jgi:hypothetical protein
MENSAQKVGFAIAAMIVVIVAAGIGVDWWDAYQFRKGGNGGVLTASVIEAPEEQRLKEEVGKLKAQNELLQWRIEDLEKQLRAGEKKELAPLKKELEELKPEGVPVKTVPSGDCPISEN